MAFDEYQKIRAVNQSTLKAILQSPKDYLEALRGQGERKAAWDFGNVYHGYLLDGKVKASILNSKTRNTKEYKEKDLKYPNIPIVTFDELECIGTMTQESRKNDVFQLMKWNSKYEITLVWEDKYTGIRCKCRIDMLGTDWFGDIKTTRATTKKAFERDFRNLNYGFQFAFYQDAIETCFGDKRIPYCIPSRKVPNYWTMCLKVPDWEIDNGRKQYRRALDMLSDCIDNDYWPGEPEHGDLEPPLYGLEE